MAVRRVSLTIAAMNTSTSSSATPSNEGATPQLPRIAVLATGGTIAGAAADATNTSGYQAGVVGVEQLLAEVPALSTVARIAPEQIASVDSKDMEMSLWTTLAQRINTLLADDDVDGVVVTHGTDTLEETAYLLHLTIKSDKPVVLTAAMRPATALSADGPLNLLNAVTVAANRASWKQGVLVAFNNQIHCGRDVTKTSTYAVDAFRSPEGGALGWVQDGQVEFQRSVVRPHTLQSPFQISAELPAVEIVTSYAGASRVAIDALVAASVKGLVIAGTGNGLIHST